MGPLLRLTVFLSRILRNPPSRKMAAVMLAALAVSVGLVLVERHIGWPEALRTERVPMHRVAP